MELKDSQVPRGFKAISSDQMYQIENNGELEYSMSKILMMENAGSRVADFLIHEFKNKINNKSIVAVCGKGNNGGDAMVAIRHLEGYYQPMIEFKSRPSLTVILLCNPNDLKTSEAKSNWKIIRNMESINTMVYDHEKLNEIEKKINESDIILDGIFGTGIKGEISEPFAKIIDIINKNTGRSFVIAIDFASGMDPDTGAKGEKCVNADATITFHRLKKGHLNKSQESGRIIVNKIGIPSGTEKGIIQD